MNNIFFKSKYKGDNSVKNQKGDFPIKGSSLDCTCANTDYFIAHVFISIVRLNRYVIKGSPSSHLEHKFMNKCFKIQLV